MPIYSPKFAGYIADVFNQDFIRCDGTPFHFDKASATSITNTANSISVTGGQGQYPQAFIDTDRAFEMTFTSAEFTMDMFEMSNTGTATDGNYDLYEAKLFTVEAGEESAPVIKLPFEVIPEATIIRGLTYAASDATTGQFTVAYATNVSTITFATGDVAVGDDVLVTYKRKITDAHIVTVNTDSASAKGELTAHVPVYSSGTDCSEGAIKGYVHIYVPRVRISAQPGFDTSYKTAATNAVTFSAIDPNRADKKMYDVVYEPVEAA